jgi:excisionase family DNA binding protein
MPWITVEETAQILNYNEEYIRRLIHQGRIQAKKHGHIWLVDPDSATHLRKLLDKPFQEGYSKNAPRRGNE